MVEKILIGLVVILATIAGVFYLQKNSLEKRVINMEASLSVQNAEIQRRTLELEEFKNQAPKVEKVIEYKYRDVAIPTSGKCEDELSAIQASLDKFFD